MIQSAANHGMETASLLNGLLEKDITSYVALIRHSVRQQDKSKDDLLNELTEEGRQAAFEFGKHLTPKTPICFYSSFVNRCVDTAGIIEKGFQSIGGISNCNVVHDKLAGFYVRNKPMMMDTIRELENMGHYVRFYQNWFDGTYSPDMLMEARASADEQLKALITICSSNKNSGHICVSHDQNLFLMNHYYLGISPTKHSVIDYLQGIVIYEEGKDFFIASHQCAPKHLNF